MSKRFIPENCYKNPTLRRVDHHLANRDQKAVIRGDLSNILKNPYIQRITNESPKSEKCADAAKISKELAFGLLAGALVVAAGGVVYAEENAHSSDSHNLSLSSDSYNYSTPSWDDANNINTSQLDRFLNVTDSSMSYKNAIELFSRMNEEKVIPYLKNNASQRNREKIAKLLPTLENKSKMRSELKNAYNISVDSRFNRDEVELIWGRINTIPKEIISGLKGVVLLNLGDVWGGNKIRAKGHGGQAAYYPDTKEVLEYADFSQDNLDHEIGHFLTDKYLEGNKYRDRPDSAIILDKFSDEFMIYIESSRERLLYDIREAKKDKSCSSLERTLRVAEVFTIPDRNYTLFFSTKDYKPKSERVPVEVNESGKIIKFGGVDVYKPDGSYNLTGLENYLYGHKPLR